MNESTAKSILNLDAFDDVQDAWDQLFFEHKQYFLTKTPLPQLFSSRLKKLLSSAEAYMILSGVRFDASEEIDLEEIVFSENTLVVEAFNIYQAKRMQSKQLIMQNQSPMIVRLAVARWIAYEKEWARSWSINDIIPETDHVVIGKEPDPMELLQELKEWSSTREVATFSRLHSDFSFLSERLKNEVKRLTLLHQKQIDERI